MACALALLVPALASSQTAIASGGSTAAAPMSVARTAFTAARLADGRVIVAGGANSVVQHSSAELYSPATQAWSGAGSMSTPRVDHTATLLDAPQCAMPGPPSWCGKVLVAGGSSGSSGPDGLNTAELYDPGTNTWGPTGALTYPHTRHTATALGDGRVLVVGGPEVDGPDDPPPPGSPGPQVTSRQAEIYDPATGTWSLAAALPANMGRFDHAATLLADGRVLLVGGWEIDGPDDPLPPDDDPLTADQGNQVPSRQAHVYDPAGNSWTAVSSLTIGRRATSLTLLNDGAALLAGGFDFASGVGGVGARRTVDLFDPSAGSWDDAGPRWLNNGRAMHTATKITDGGGVVPDGSVVALGGKGLLDTNVSAELYDPGLDVWRFLGPLLAPRQEHAGVLLRAPGCASLCGRILVAGGKNQSNVPTATAELYDVTAPTEPGGVAALKGSASSESSILLSFGAAGSVEGYAPPASDYLIRQSSSPIAGEAGFAAAQPLCGGVCTFSPSEVGQQIQLTVTGLALGVTYHYAVRARDGDGQLGPIATTSATPGVDDVAPGAVQLIGAKALSKHRARLRFRAAGSNGVNPPPAGTYVVKQSRKRIKSEPRFRRARALCKGRCEFEPASVGDELVLTVKGLAAGSRHYFAVRAVDDTGNDGPFTSFKRVRTKRAPRQ